MNRREYREKQAQSWPDRCQALTNDSYQRPTNDQCTHHASVKFGGGIQLCCRHASIYALSIALDNGSAKMMPQVKVPPVGSIRITGRVR